MPISALTEQTFDRANSTLGHAIGLRIERATGDVAEAIGGCKLGKFSTGELRSVVGR